MKTSPEFVFARNLPLGTRLAWIALLAAAGVGIQIAVSPLLGWGLVFVAVMLGVTRSVSNKPERLGRPDWQNVTMAEVEAAQKLIAEGDKVKRSAGSWSCASAAGCFGAFGLLMAAGFIVLVLASVADEAAPYAAFFRPVVAGGSTALVFGVDILTLFAPLWMSGRVKTWEPPYMRMRLEQLMHIYKTASADPRLEFSPSLAVAKTQSGSVPMDCKLMVKIKDTDPNFMGIQAQTSLNDVQGTKHPYTYCVLIAKPEFGLVGKAKQVVESPPGTGGLAGLFADSNTKKEAVFSRFHEAIVELKREGDVQIAVVRQKTSGTGYRTSPRQAMEVFSAAYQLAVGVLQR